MGPTSRPMLIINSPGLLNVPPNFCAGVSKSVSEATQFILINFLKSKPDLNECLKQHETNK